MSKHSLSFVALSCLLIAAAAACLLSNPFPVVLSSRSVSLTGLSPAQKANICLAARSLNGYIIKPGQEFSFNAVVGPRNDRRGYRPAPSYLGPESPSTFGGGICLVSSALYQAALESNMTIRQRIAHLRTVRTVAAGYDATVWYGQADLRIKNDLQEPVMLCAHNTANECLVEIVGTHAQQRYRAKLSRVVTAANTREMSVEVFRSQSGKSVLVSRDLYRLSP